MFNTSQPLPQQTAVSEDWLLAGNCKGRFVLTSLSSDFLQSLLPHQLELAPQNYTTDGQHPVMLMHNYTYLHSTPHLVEITTKQDLELKLQYNEFILMLPFVQFKDRSLNTETAYCFLPILYLDSIMAVLGGRIFWEFNKEMARFTVTESDFLIRSEFGDQPLFKSTFTPAGDTVRATTVQNFDAIIPILNLPVVEFGLEGYITSIYKIDYENADLTPVTTCVQNISSKYLPPEVSINSASIENQVLGAFNMNYTWELSRTKHAVHQ